MNVLIEENKETLLSSSADRMIKNWDLETGRCIQTLKGHRGEVSSLSCYPDIGVVSGSPDKTLRIWDIRTGTAINVIHTAQIVLSHHWNGDSFAVGSNTGIQIYSGSGNCTGKLSSDGSISATRFLQGESSLLIASREDGGIQAWDLNTGDTINLMKHRATILAMQYNCTTLFSADDRGYCYIRYLS